MKIPRFRYLPLLALSATLFSAGCHKDQAATTSQPNQATDASATQPGDPANANIAPISNTSGATSTAPAPGQSQTQDTSNYQQSAPPPQSNSGSYYPPSSQSDQSDDDYADYEPAAYTAPQPPPALPDYDQPPAPGDDYLWTPGYWSYASTGYYWVPGVWVQAPYQGALWTPGYWGYHNSHYEFYRGYWGRHIGYYGGIDYGFGYIGVGYQGGYWQGDHFDYNRSVNNINVNIVHNVYNYNVQTPRVSVRVAFNGGSGGIQVRPRPAELAAFREPHAPPMRAQLDNEHSASTNRAQFAAVNQGRPASLVVARPLNADRDVHPVAPPPMHSQPDVQQHNQPMMQQHNEPNQQHNQPMQQQHSQPMQQQHNQPMVQQHNQPMEQQHNQPMQQHSQPAQQHPPVQQTHPQAQQQAARPAPERQAEPQRQQPQQHQQPQPQHQAAPPQHQQAPQPEIRLTRQIHRPRSPGGLRRGDHRRLIGETSHLDPFGERRSPNPITPGH